MCNVEDSRLVKEPDATAPWQLDVPCHQELFALELWHGSRQHISVYLVRCASFMEQACVYLAALQFVVHMKEVQTHGAGITAGVGGYVYCVP